MDLRDKIETLGSIWDKIAEANSIYPLSVAEKLILDRRFEQKRESLGIEWKSFKESILKKSK